MATETKTFYPRAYEGASAATITNGTNPVGKGSSNTTYAVIKMAGQTSPGYCYWPFDVSTIPGDATIDSVVCNAKIKTASTSFVSTLQLYCSGAAKGEAVTDSTSKEVVVSLTTGIWTRSELSGIRLRIHTAPSFVGQASVWFYGADLTVTYTYQSEKFMLKLGGSWTDVARVFKKVSGIWVEQTELANVIEDGVRYKNGGFYEDPTRTITITGTGHADRAAVIVNGVTYTTAQSIKVQKGTVITLHNRMWDSSAASSNKIVVDGVTVVSGGGDYNCTVNNNCTIALYDGTSGSYKYGTITVTTVYDSGSNPTVVLDGVTYEFEEGMTWTQWCNSSYNTGGWYIRNGEVYNGSKWIYDPVLASYDISEALIVAGRAYQANG